MSSAPNGPDADRMLDEALALPPAERDAYLVRATGGDAALLDRLRAVVREAGVSDGFLDPDVAVASAVADALEAADDGAEASHALAPGVRVEHYEIVALIGRGGMGEVYRARDRRLGREVALKVLPARFAGDPERLARFRREARVLASLSHPGIGAIYGLAEAPGIEALVLEYVEGPTLAERIGGEPMPVADVIAIGRRIAEALDAAHAAGVLHRDLKPANIKVTGEGVVKILDFGLAKALDPPDPASDASTDLSAETPHRLLGTAAYMSPEQVRREALDQRTDIWAFGCVLFEMLTGARAFPGAALPDVLARVLEREPAYGLLPEQTPRALRRLLRRTLEKDRRRRLGYIGDAVLDLDDAAHAPPVENESAPVSRARRVWPFAAAGAAVVLAAAAASRWDGAPPAPRAEPVARFAVSLGDTTPTLSYQPMLAVAPDGQTIAYRATSERGTLVYLRRLSELDASPVPGTEGASGLFFSPDSRWLGFDSGGTLKRVALAGGPPVVIGPAPGGVTATWTDDDTIVFATNTTRVLERMPAAGGPTRPLTALDTARGDSLHLLPQALPGGRAVLFTIAAGVDHHVAVADLESGAIRLVTPGTHGRFVAPDRLVFVRQGTLFGQRFDPAAATVSGDPVPLVDGLEHTDHTVVHYDVSPSGSLAYLPSGQLPVARRKLVWFDRGGRAAAVPAEPRPYSRVSLSPDGRRAAVSIEDRDNTDVWIVDLDRGAATRLTSSAAIETAPVWSPDGRWIVFRSERAGPGLFRRDPVAAGPIEQITTTDGPIHSPSSWAPDSRTLFLALFRSHDRQSIARVSPPDGQVDVLLEGEFAQTGAHLSPDGHWLAYQSNESGRPEVFVRPYPELQSGRWQISASGGTSPRWAPDGRELYFLDGRGLAAARVSTTGRFEAAAPRRLFEITPFGSPVSADFEVSPDGGRFLFVMPEPDEPLPPARLVVVQGWAGEIDRRLAESR